jgi:acid phosphatase type 7
MMTGTPVRATSASGETATFTFVGRSVGWVARLGPDRGQALVSVDAGPGTSVNLHRNNASSRRIVFRAAWPTIGPHTLTLTTTSAGSRVDVDAFAVVTDPVNGAMVGAGDISSCASTGDSDTAAVVETVLADDPSTTVFTAGDNVYPNGGTQYFSDCYDPTWGAVKAQTRPDPGNHDYENNPGAGPYFAYFGESAGPAGRGWYKFESGTWRVYSLNSECANSTCSDAQYNWLMADLAAEPHRCVVAIWHRPVFSTGPHGNSTRMASIFKLLYDNGAELVITGHDHMYERFAPADSTGVPDAANGVREFVVGTGGAALYAFKTDSSLIEVRNNATHGVLSLQLMPGAYDWEFMPVAGATGFSDSGSASCH